MNVSVLGCLAGLVLLALPIYIIYAFDLRLMRRFVRSLGVLVVAVAVLASVIGLLMRCSVWLSVGAAVVLGGLSAVVSVLRSGVAKGRMLGAVLAAGVVPLLAVSLLVLGVVLGVHAPWDARWLVPMVALLAGSASGLVASALHTYHTGLAYHNEFYLYLLGNGATHREAVRHFMRRGFQAALLPLMKRWGGMGLTVAPAVMLALVMGGASMWTAAVAEVTVAGAVATYVLATFWGAVVLMRRWAFDEYERLKPAGKNDNNTADTPDPQDDTAGNVAPENDNMEPTSQWNASDGSLEWEP